MNMGKLQHIGMGLVVLLVVVFVILTFGQWLGWVVLRQRWHVKRNLPPGPMPLPLLGNLLHLITSPLPHRSLATLARRYGPLMFLWMGSSPTIVVSSPSVARHIFHSHDKVFASRPPSEVSKRLFYGGGKTALTAPYGPHWHFIRKLYTTHVLGSRHLQELHSPVITDEIGHLIHHMYISSSTPTDPLNLTSLLSTLVENIMCRIVLRQRASDVMISTATSPNGNGIARNSGSTIHLGEIVREGNLLLGASLIGDFIPPLGLLDYKTKCAMDRWLCSFDAILEAVLSKRVAEAMTADTIMGELVLVPPRDILDALLALDPPLKKDKIKAMMLELIMGGINTSVVTLDWAMAEILSNPRVLKKLQVEADRVVGKERMVGMEDLPSLLYMKAVVKETLRKHPPGPLLMPHLSTEDCELLVEEGGVEEIYTLPKGTTMLLNAWAIGNDPATWDEPEAFMPERFMVPAHAHVDVRGQHFEVLPFGSGRRICPAMGLALAMVELVVASLAHCFEWAVPCNAVDMAEKYGLTVSRRAPLLAVPITFRLSKKFARQTCHNY